MQLVFIHFFFQAEDGIRDFHVTGVQTCALPISALWLAALEPDGTPALIAVFVLGGFSFPMYSLSGSHVNDLVGRDHVVGASSAILLANGIGAVTGPVGASLVMTALGPAGLWFFVALVHAALGVYAAVRLIKRWHLPAPDKDKFIPFPVRSGG